MFVGCSGTTCITLTQGRDEMEMMMMARTITVLGYPFLFLTIKRDDTSLVSGYKSDAAGDILMNTK